MFNKVAIMDQPENPLRGKRLLVVEDQPLIAMDCAVILSHAGAKDVQIASTTEQAAQLIRASDLDAVILDFVLSDNNSKNLQALLIEKGIPFVVVSGYPPVLIRQGSEAVLQKPVRPKDLFAAITAACAKSMA